ACEPALDEDAEAVAAAELPFALAGAAAGGEGGGAPGRVRLARGQLGLPLQQPVRRALAHGPPGVEVAGSQRPEGEAPSKELDGAGCHVASRYSRAASSRPTFCGRAVWP